MWSCSFWTQPQKVVGYHRETHHFSEGKSAKEFTAPQHTRSILPPIHPDKIIAALHGRYFFTNRTLCGCTNLRILFTVVDCTTSKCYSRAWKKPDVVSALRPAFFIPHLDSFISRLNVIPCHDLTLSVSEPENAAAQTGAGTSFGANGGPLTWAAQPLLIFRALTIQKQLPRNGFERSGRGQEPSRGHKFSILENFLSIRDFTSAMRLHFRSDLVGACLPQTLLIFAPCGAKERRVVLT